MFHNVYIYNNDKKLIQRGKIWCDDYYISNYDNYMLLVALSDSMQYRIYGSYIIVI